MVDEENARRRARTATRQGKQGVGKRPANPTPSEVEVGHILMCTADTMHCNFDATTGEVKAGGTCPECARGESKIKPSAHGFECACSTCNMICAKLCHELTAHDDFVKAAWEAE
jgi:hypothetical protein